MSRTFAYCRVSTAEQTSENQSQEIAAAGFSVKHDRVVTETISGSIPSLERPAFRKLIQDKLEDGDILIVTKLDRLGRNAMDVRQTVEALTAKNVRVHCLALGGMDLTSPAGKMTMGVIAAVAEFERDLLVERTQAGLSRAKAAGIAVGRPPRLSAIELAKVKEELLSGKSVAAIARDAGTSRQTIMRARDTQLSVRSES